MSVDNAIRALSYAQAPTLGTAIALIAKHRQDLDIAMRVAETRQAPLASQGAAEERALERMVTAARPHMVDRKA